MANQTTQAAAHDAELIARARRLSVYDSGWQELRDACHTQAARDEIDEIELSKYHRDEYRHNCI